jgi:hypothetical protein
MLLPARQDGEVVDESLHFAFTTMGRKKKSRRCSGGRTRDGDWLWRRDHRSPFLNLKRIDKYNRFHHNPPMLMVCSVYHELIPPIARPLRENQVRFTSASQSDLTSGVTEGRSAGKPSLAGMVARD